MSSTEWDGYWKSKSLLRKLVEFARLHYFSRVFAGIVRGHAPRGAKRILEAGCGTGTTLARLRGYETVGLDYSKPALAIAKHNCGRAVLGDMKKMPFKNKEFDVVFNQGVMEHFSGSEFAKMMKEMKRVAKKVVVIVPSKTSVLKFLPIYGEEEGDYMSKGQLRRRMEKSFKNVEVHYLPQAFFFSMYAVGCD